MDGRAAFVSHQGQKYSLRDYHRVQDAGII
jgi:hypothetical protein